MQLMEIGQGLALIDYEFMKNLLETNRFLVRADNGDVVKIEVGNKPFAGTLIWDVSMQLCKRCANIPLIVTQQELQDWVMTKTTQDFLVLLNENSSYFKNRETIEKERQGLDSTETDWNFPDNNYVLLVKLKHLILPLETMEFFIVRKSIDEEN